MTTLMKLRALFSREEGQVLMVAALTMAMFLGFVGLVIDGGMFYTERRQAQNAADEAAMAGARVLASGGSVSSASTAATGFAQANGFETSEISVHIPPVSGEHAGEDGYVEVEVTRDPDTFFIHVIVSDVNTVAARGVATYTAGAGDGYALFANDDDCNNSDTLQVTANVVLVTGTVHTNGNASIPSNNNEFNGDLTYACDLTVTGNNNTFSSAPQSAAPRPFPVDYVYADFPCTREFSGDTDLKSVADIWVAGDPNSNELLPGVYCSTGGLTISGGGGVTGEVTLAAQGPITITGSDFNLTPYWNNVLFLTESSSSLAIDVSGNNNSWEGLIVAPNGRANVQGEAGSSLSGGILADTIRVSGEGLSITSVDFGQGGAAIIRLVE